MSAITAARMLPFGRPSLLTNQWVIALTVTMATFMEVLDTSIANVSLPHIAGNLSASINESTWVLTSYLVANAIVLPLSGWLSSILGRKRFYMMCVLMFTISSMMCGLATQPGPIDFLPRAAGDREAAVCSRRSRRFWSTRFRRRSAAWRWPCTAWRYFALRFSGRRSAVGSPTTIPGAGFFSSTCRSAAFR